MALFSPNRCVTVWYFWPRLLQIRAGRTSYWKNHKSAQHLKNPRINKFYMSHEAHATFGSINVRKCQIRKEGLHKSVALVLLTLDSFSSESLVWLPFLMSSLLMSTEFFARQNDFSCSFIVDRLGNRFPQNWQAKNNVIF